MNTIFNILDYGAINDNKTDNTIAIQSAIDDASKVGGKVIIPPGIYKTSKVYLKGKNEISKDDKTSGIKSSDSKTAKKLIKNTYKTLLTRG